MWICLNLARWPTEKYKPFEKRLSKESSSALSLPYIGISVSHLSV